MTEIHYIVKKDTLFSLKKGDIVLYAEVQNTFTPEYNLFVKDFNKGVYTFLTNNLDPGKETEFFEEIDGEIADFKFRPGDKVYFSTSEVDLKNVNKSKYIPLHLNQSNGNLVVHRVYHVKFNKVYKKVICVKTDETAKWTYDIYEEYIFNRINYFYLNSKGEICTDIKGRNYNVDNFRFKSHNYFHTHEDAKEKLEYVWNLMFNAPV